MDSDSTNREQADATRPVADFVYQYCYQANVALQWYASTLQDERNANIHLFNSVRSLQQQVVEYQATIERMSVLGGVSAHLQLIEEHQRLCDQYHQEIVNNTKLTQEMSEIEDRAEEEEV